MRLVSFPLFVSILQRFLKFFCDFFANQNTLFQFQPREKGRMRFHRLQNVKNALDFLKQRKVRLSFVKRYVFFKPYIWLC